MKKDLQAESAHPGASCSPDTRGALQGKSLTRRKPPAESLAGGSGCRPGMAPSRLLGSQWLRVLVTAGERWWEDARVLKLAQYQALSSTTGDQGLIGAVCHRAGSELFFFPRRYGYVVLICQGTMASGFSLRIPNKVKKA